MKYNTQTDDSWSKEIMTSSDTWIDTLGRWGCLITCLANILQYITEKEITPRNLNDIIKMLKAYRYLENLQTPERNASILIWSKFVNHFSNMIEMRLRINRNEYRSRPDYFYIACVRHSLTNLNHYINILNKTDKYFWCFDVENGHIKTYKDKEILFLHEVKKK